MRVPAAHWEVKTAVVAAGFGAEFAAEAVAVAADAPGIAAAGAHSHSAAPVKAFITHITTRKEGRIFEGTRASGLQSRKKSGKK